MNEQKPYEEMTAEELLAAGFVKKRFGYYKKGVFGIIVIATPKKK